MYSPAFSSHKFRGLMLYAAHRARELNDPWFGAVKLNKILFFSDFMAYKQLGKSITGATYQKLSEGPAPRELLREREVLISNAEARLEPTRVFNYVQHRLIPVKDSILAEDYFNNEEIPIINEVIETLSPMTAAQVSELSHNEMGWRTADLHESIPYETSLLAPWPQETEVDLQADG